METLAAKASTTSTTSKSPGHRERAVAAPASAATSSKATTDGRARAVAPSTPASKAPADRLPRHGCFFQAESKLEKKRKMNGVGLQGVKCREKGSESLWLEGSTCSLLSVPGGGLGLHGREGGDSYCLHQRGVVYRFSSSICQTLTLPRNTP